MKQFLKVLSVVKFIAEAAAMFVVGLFRIRAANAPRAGNCRETGAFPALLPRLVTFLPRVIVASKPHATEFYPIAAAVRSLSPSRIIPFRNRRALIVSPNNRIRGGFANMMANRRLANHTD